MGRTWNMQGTNLPPTKKEENKTYIDYYNENVINDYEWG